MIPLQAPAGGCRRRFATTHTVGFRTGDIDWCAEVEIVSRGDDHWSWGVACIEPDTGPGATGVTIEGETMALIGALIDGKWASLRDLAHAGMAKEEVHLLAKHFAERAEDERDARAEQRFQEQRDREMEAS